MVTNLGYFAPTTKGTPVINVVFSGTFPLVQLGLSLCPSTTPKELTPKTLSTRHAGYGLLAVYQLFNFVPKFARNFRLTL